MRRVRKARAVRGFGQRMPFRISVDRAHQPLPQHEGFEGQARSARRTNGASGWATGNARRPCRGVERRRGVMRGMVDHARDPRIGHRHGSTARDDSSTAARPAAISASAGALHRTSSASGASARSSRARRAPSCRARRTPRASARPTRLSGSTKTKASSPAPETMRWRPRRPRSPTLQSVSAVCERQPARKDDGDLDRVVRMEVGVAKPVGCLEHPDAQSLAHRDLRAPERHRASPPRPARTETTHCATGAKLRRWSGVGPCSCNARRCSARIALVPCQP